MWKDHIKKPIDSNIVSVSKKTTQTPNLDIFSELPLVLCNEVASFLKFYEIMNVANTSKEAKYWRGLIRTVVIKPRITDEGLLALSALTGLKRLGLLGCNRITDEGLSKLSSLTNLTHLDLCWCNRITDEGLSKLNTLPGLIVNYCW